MKLKLKVYRVFLWIGFVFSLICLLVSFFMDTPVAAGKHDVIIFRASGVVLFIVITVAFVMKLFFKKTVFAVKSAKFELCYWVIVCVISGALAYVVSFAHTDKYNSDYKSYIAEQNVIVEESSFVEMTMASTTTTVTSTTTSIVTTVSTTTELLIIETDPVTEVSTEAVTAADALIDDKGYTYYFNDMLEFDDFDVKINRVKLVSDLSNVESGYNYYYAIIDYTVYNKTDNDLRYYIRQTGNVLGEFRVNGYERMLCGNSDIKDDDFVETDNFKRAMSAVVEPYKSVDRYYCGIIKRELDDPKKGMRLRINDEMEIDLYFCTDESYYIVQLQLN